LSRSYHSTSPITNRRFKSGHQRELNRVERHEVTKVIREVLLSDNYEAADEVLFPDTPVTVAWDAL
jgi:hypothetical protein